jgi:hypothetical protein
MLLQKFKATVANFFANICKRFSPPVAKSWLSSPPQSELRHSVFFAEELHSCLHSRLNG